MKTIYITESEWLEMDELCPDCGVEMEETDGDGRTVSNGYDCPPDYIPYWVEYTCPVCGKVIRVSYNEEPFDVACERADMARDDR